MIQKENSVLFREPAQGPRVHFLHRWYAVFLCVCLLCWPCSAAGFQAQVEARTGYDSNPALSEASEGSGFVHYIGRLHQFLDISKTALVDLFMDGGYQQYWQTGDNYRLICGGGISYPLAGGRVIPALLVEAGLWRDHLVEAEERNEYLLGLKADWFVNHWASLDVGAEWSWIRFQNPSRPFSGRGQGRTGEPKGKGQGKGHVVDNVLDRVYPGRKDLMTSGLLTLHIFPSSRWTVSLEGAYRNLDSSLSLESYQEYQGGIMLFWNLASSWRLEGGMGWARREYDRIPKGIKDIRKEDNSYFGLLQVRRFWRGMEFFGMWEWRRGQAPYHYTSYEQMVIQCGLSWSFWH